MNRLLALNIPIAPSVNRLYVNFPGKGRLKSKDYRRWVEACTPHLWQQKPAGGFPFFDAPFHVTILVPVQMKGDVDNRLKAAIDILKKPWGIIADDSLAMSCLISRNPDIAPGMCRVILRDASPIAEAA